MAERSMRRLLGTPLLLVASMAQWQEASSFLYSVNRMNLLTGIEQGQLPPINLKESPIRYEFRPHFFTFDYDAPPLAALSNRTQSRDTRNAPLPKTGSSLPITYTNDHRSVKRWVQQHITSPEQIQILGLDVESVPNMPSILNTAQHEGSATVQISTLDAAIVIQLTHRRGKQVSQILRPISSLLANPNKILVGAGIDADVMELHQDFGRSDLLTTVTSRFDLGGVGAKSKCESNRVGLKTLVEEVLQLEFQKPQRVSVSDWSRVPLSLRQLNYAARDAWAGCAVLTALERIDPEQFHLERFVQLEQRPVTELLARAQKRREAKRTLKELNQIYQGNDVVVDLGGGVIFTEHHPFWVHKRKRKLRNVLEATKPDGMLPFDMSRFGFELQKRQ